MADVEPQHESLAPAIDVRGVRLTYPAQRRQSPITALNDVDLVIAPGERVAMLGPNGSGKSTLMNIISGLLVADAGEVRVFDERDPAVIARTVGIVFQHASLDPHMSVWENLRDHALLQGLPSDEVRDRVNVVLERVGVSDRIKQRVGTLSGGLARRVDLARALLHEPPLLLLDEPTVGLDPAAREQYLSLIEETSKRPNVHARTILMSTHLVDEADRQDRVVLMHEGRIVADGSPTKLRQAIGARVLTVHDRAWQPPVEQRETWRSAAGGWRCAFDDVELRMRDLLGELAAANVPFSLAPPTLADVFEHHTGTRLSERGDADEFTLATPRTEPVA